MPSYAPISCLVQSLERRNLPLRGRRDNPAIMVTSQKGEPRSSLSQGLTHPRRDLGISSGAEPFEVLDNLLTHKSHYLGGA